MRILWYHTTNWALSNLSSVLPWCIIWKLMGVHNRNVFAMVGQL